MRLDLRVDQNDPRKMAMLLNGRFICLIPWRIADVFAKKLQSLARQCEEYENANKIIVADALLIRTGAPFSLTNNPKIREESYKEAQWNSDIRKGMPMTVPSAKKTGTPVVVKTRARN